MGVGASDHHGPATGESLHEAGNFIWTHRARDRGGARQVDACAVVEGAAHRACCVVLVDELVAVDERQQILVGEKHAAADGERAGRHVDFHAALVLGNLPADEAQHALAESGDDLALILLGVVDELVDDEIGAWSHGEGRAVHQQNLHDPTARGVDALIVEDRRADLDRGAVAEGVRLDGSSHTHLLGKRRAWRPGERQRSDRSAGEEERTKPA